MFFNSSKKLFLFSRYLNFEKNRKNRLIRKKANFKIHDVTAWLTNNCHTHIAQYLKK